MASTSNTVEQTVEEVVVVETKPVAKKSKATKTKSVTSPKEEPTSTVATETQVQPSENTDVSALTERVKLLEASVAQLMAEVKELTNVARDSKPKKEKEEKKPRPPTAYNIFMKNKMVELKESQPTLNNIDRMKLAAEAWTESKKS